MKRIIKVPPLKLSLRVKRSNLVSCREIAAHLSGARNDTNNRALKPDRWIWVRHNNGITLIELVIVISIIAILVVALGFQFQGWMGRYKVESQIKEMYVDLMNTKARAMQKNRVHFVTLAQTTQGPQYTIREDLDPWPDGDGALTSNDSNRPSGYNEPIPLLQKTLSRDYVLKFIGADALPETINFNRMGLSSLERKLHLSSEPSCCLSDPNCSADCVNPDYDCITIIPTKITIGKNNGTTCVEK